MMKLHQRMSNWLGDPELLEYLETDFKDQTVFRDMSPDLQRQFITAITPYWNRFQQTKKGQDLERVYFAVCEWVTWPGTPYPLPPEELDSLSKYAERAIFEYCMSRH